MFIFAVQLTTSRIGNLTRLIHTLLYVMTIHTYIHTYIHMTGIEHPLEWKWKTHEDDSRWANVWSYTTCLVYEIGLVFTFCGRGERGKPVGRELFVLINITEMLLLLYIVEINMHGGEALLAFFKKTFSELVCKFYIFFCIEKADRVSRIFPYERRSKTYST